MWGVGGEGLRVLGPGSGFRIGVQGLWALGPGFRDWGTGPVGTEFGDRGPGPVYQFRVQGTERLSPPPPLPVPVLEGPELGLSSRVRLVLKRQTGHTLGKLIPEAGHQGRAGQGRAGKAGPNRLRLYP